MGRMVSAREDKERVRLLYVGFTRARDHLVLALRQDKKGRWKTEWLDTLCDREGGPLVDLPSADSAATDARDTVAVPRSRATARSTASRFRWK